MEELLAEAHAARARVSEARMTEAAVAATRESIRAEAERFRKEARDAELRRREALVEYQVMKDKSEAAELRRMLLDGPPSARRQSVDARAPTPEAPRSREPHSTRARAEPARAAHRAAPAKHAPDAAAPTTGPARAAASAYRPNTPEPRGGGYAIGKAPQDQAAPAAVRRRAALTIGTTSFNAATTKRRYNTTLGAERTLPLHMR